MITGGKQRQQRQEKGFLFLYFKMSKLTACLYADGNGSIKLKIFYM